MKKMKVYRVLIFIALLLIVSNVKAQETEISRLKTQTITITRKVSKEKTVTSQSWILVESDVKQVRPDPRTPDDINGSNASFVSYPVPQGQSPRPLKRRYSISYGGLSLNGDSQWLRLDASPNGGMGWLEDIGEMNWAAVDRMPALVLKPIPQGISIAVFGGETLVTPGFIIKPLAGHVYAVHVKDDHTDFRAIFRVESVDANGECKLSWKRIPSKWALGPGADLVTQQSKANESRAKVASVYVEPPANESLAKVASVYVGPPANEILTKVASVYAGCRSYYDEGFISTRGSVSAGSHFRTTFSRPDTLGFEFWQGSQQPWVVWKKGGEVTNLRPDGSVGKPTPFDIALAQLAMNSKGSSLLVPPLLLPSLFRTADAFALIVDPKVAGEDKVDGLEAFRVSGTLLGQQVELWIDKTDYLIRKLVRTLTVGNQQVESTTHYKPRLNSNIPLEHLTFKPPAGKVSPGAVSSIELKAPSPDPPSVAPRLRSREFGSSLSRRPNEKAIDRERSAEDDVVRVDTDLVLSAVLVLDSQGKIVTGLTKEDFIIKENNNLQQVTSFSLGDNKDLPRSIVLIIDYSPSQLPYIRTSIEAAKTLVDKLNPKDRMALVTDDVQLLADFTSDKQLLKEKLDGLKSSALSGVMGASLQYDSLMATLNELFDNEDTQPIVILQSDGDQLDSLKGGKAVLGPFMFPRKYGLEDILAKTERVRATIYPVISGIRFLGVPEAELLKRARLDWDKRRAANLEMLRARNSPEPTNAAEPGNDVLQRIVDRWVHCQVALAEVAKSAGAWAEFLEEPEQADEIYTRVLNNIERRYVLGYYPTNRARDGKRRTVSVEVRNHPEYIVVGHKSYRAREE
jgi:VWFA-related protein